MKLTLSVISYAGDGVASPKKITLNQQGASIGRSPDNTLVLQDEKRYVGRQHALIEFKSPDYFIKDISTNGVFLNRSGTPLGKNNFAKLKNGDLITIGDYEIEIKLQNEQGFDRFNYVPPVTDPRTGVSEHGDSPLPPVPIHDVIQKESIFLFGEKSETPPGFPDDSFHGQNFGRQKDYGGVSPLRRPFPVSSPNQGSVVETVLNSSDYAETTPPLFDENKPSRVILPKDWHRSSDEKTTGEKSLGDNTEALKILRKAAEQKVDIFDQAGENTDVTPIPEKKLDSNGLADEFIQNFLRGANLDPDKFRESMTAETFFVIGTILRVSIQGTKDVLLSRTLIKDEADVPLTHINTNYNNPIKFSVNANEALYKLLFNKDSNGYMPANEAIREAFEDIQGHEMAVIAGMKAALRTVFKHFDPKIQKTRMQKLSPLVAKIPILKKIKLWNFICQNYEEMEQELEDKLDKLYGHSFTEAYRQKMQLFKSSKKNSN